MQRRNVIACVKHFAFNSIEIARYKVDVRADARTEREVYFPHVKDCIDAGAASVMSDFVYGIRDTVAAARMSMTLLKNSDGVLPFSKEGVRKLAVIGRLARVENTGDYGSNRVFPPLAA